MSNRVYHLMLLKQEERKQENGVRPSLSELAEESVLQHLGTGESIETTAHSRRLYATRLVTQRKFLDALALGATIGHAAQQAGVGRRTVYDWLRDDVRFSHTCAKIRSKLALTPIFAEAQRQSSEQGKRDG